MKFPFCKPRKLDLRFPSWPTSVEQQFVTFNADGSVDIYCSGDVHLTREQLREICNTAERFMYEYERAH